MELAGAVAMSVFDQCFAITVGEEGGFGRDPADAGNWTGGRVGAGVCKGTKFGVSAASYPQLDIANLTLDDARAIYRRDYFDRVRGDDLPAPLALLAFDAAVNNGVGMAVRWLQTVAGVAEDGDVGPHTIAGVTAAAARLGGARLCADYMALRLAFMTLLPTWKLYGANAATGRPEGWASRLCLLPYLSTTITA
jgi:lysozyme family protein